MYGFTLFVRHSRPVYGGPSCNIGRANDISVGCVPALHALKLALAAAVLLCDVSAVWALPTSVPRVYDANRDTGELSLVREECAKLKECPPCVHRALRLPNCSPIADALQVLQGDASAGAFALGDDALADAVVFNRAEAGLPARDPAKATPGAARPSSLEPGTMRGVSLAYGLYSVAGVLFTIGVDGEIANAEVHAEPILRFDRRTVGDLNGHEQEEFAFAVDEVRLSAYAFESGAMVVADDDGQYHAPVECCYAHAVDAALEGVEPLVERDGAVRLEMTEARLISLVRLAYLRDHADSVLRVQVETRPQFAVVEVLQLDLVRGAQIERAFGEPRARSVHPLHRGEQPRLIIGGHDQLARRYQFHGHKHRTSIQERKRKQTCFLLALKDEASALEIR